MSKEPIPLPEDKCTCYVKARNTKGFQTIVFCPLHEEAGSLLNMLMVMTSAVDMALHMMPEEDKLGMMIDPWGSLADAVDAIRRAGHTYETIEETLSKSRDSK